MDLGSLNDAQRRAATYDGRHLLVLAGAGTGKTRVIIARALWLLEQGCPPESIRILSFTKKSAGEIVDRIRIEAKHLPAAKELHGSTFHSWCMELIGKYAGELGLENYVGINAFDRFEAIGLIMKSVNTNLPADVMDSILSFKTNTLSSMEEAIRTKRTKGELRGYRAEDIRNALEECTEVERKYREFKQNHRYIDYDDMLKLMADALAEKPEFRARVASEYTNILVDEMQDTNPLQWRLLESFFPTCRFFCVGDDAQSIYAFRGADFKSIHSFSERVPGGEVYKLTDNYRSTQEILDVSNWLLRQSPLAYEKDLHAVRGKGDIPQFHFSRERREEAAMLLSIIRDGLDAGKQYSDFMILSRTSRRVEEIKKALDGAGIPVLSLGGRQSLVEKTYVQDVMSALKIIINYRDELSWHVFLRLWAFDGWFDAPAFIENAMACGSLDEALASLPKEDALSAKITNTLTAARNCWDQPVAAFSLIVSNMTPILKRHNRNWEACKYDYRTLQLLAGTCKDVPAFVGEYVADPDAALIRHSLLDDRPNCVTISTAHSAKGLECDTVIVLTREFPSFWAHRKEDFEEERRCLYVALTRAKNSLILTDCAPDKPDARALLDSTPFFRGIPDELISTFPRDGIIKPFYTNLSLPKVDLSLP
ncbi:MAG: ATP-dependent helicase [Bacteroidales bacterium]|nr:ATP-dependent helicase [Bacteroidales bacterium]